MKRMFDEDLSLSELKAMIKSLHKKKSFNYVLIGALGVLLLAAIAALVFAKLRCCCDDNFDDFDFDDDDDYCDCDDDDDDDF